MYSFLSRILAHIGGQLRMRSWLPKYSNFCNLDHPNSGEFQQTVKGPRMGFFSSNKRRNAELLVKGGRIFSAFSMSDAFFQGQLTPHLAEIVAAFRAGITQTLDEAKAHAEAVMALPPLQRGLCSASILHGAGKSLCDSGPLGKYYCDLIVSAGMTGCSACFQEVLEREDKDQAIQVARALDVFARFAGDFQRAQAVYLKGHLDYGVLGGSKGALAGAVREALALLERETNPIFAEPVAEQRAQWSILLGDLESS